MLSSMKSTLGNNQTITNDAIWQWCNLTLALTFNSFGGCSGHFCYHSYFPYLQIVINLPPAATSRNVDCITVDLKIMNHMRNCCHRNISPWLVFVFFYNCWKVEKGPLLQAHPPHPFQFINSRVHTFYDWYMTKTFVFSFFPEKDLADDIGNMAFKY